MSSQDGMVFFKDASRQKTITAVDELNEILD